MEAKPPNGWATAALEELIQFALGGDWGKDLDSCDPEYTEVRCIRASEIKNWDEEKGITAAARKIKRSSLEKRRLSGGDILVEISGGGPDQPVGRTVLIDNAALSQHPQHPKICTNFFRMVRPFSSVNPKYLNYFLQHFYRTGPIGRYQAGSNNLRNLKFNDYLRLTIPLPPFGEQSRIVAKIEELFSELDKGIEALKTAREQLKVYRQAVLKHAFEGKLTARWREENKDKLELPEQLLARIQQERQGRYQQQLKDWQAAVKAWDKSGKQGKKPVMPKSAEAISIPDADATEQLPEIPVGWAWFHLRQLSEISGGLTKNQKRNSMSQRMRYLRVANVYADKLLLDDIQEIGVTDDEAKKVVLQTGDILVVEGNGSVEQIGRVALWDGSIENCGHQNHLIRVRLSGFIRSRVVLLFLLSPLGRDFIVNEASSTSGLHTLSISKVGNLMIPVMSEGEANELIKQVDLQISNIDKLQVEIEDQLIRSESLRQSILKKAFSGQLVPQDPNDEPASVLLERIRAEATTEPNRAQQPRRQHAVSNAKAD